MVNEFDEKNQLIPEMISALVFIIGLFMAYPILVYPMVIYLAQSIRKTRKKNGAKVSASDETPEMDFLIAAYNEEEILEKKLRNTLELNYPREKLNIYVATDGSTDRTNQIVEGFFPAVKLIKTDTHAGKIIARNESVKLSNSPILVFSDANSMYEKNALKELVKPFADPNVGAVCGELKLIPNDNDRYDDDIEAQYWSWERWLKKQESQFFSTIGANGSIYAVRRECYEFLPDFAMDDLMVPVFVVLKGYKSVYQPSAVCYEKSTGRIDVEYRRHRRILARSLTSIWAFRKEISTAPIQFKFIFISHKLLRWLIPLWYQLLMLTTLAAPGVLSKIAFFFMLSFELFGFFIVRRNDVYQRLTPGGKRLSYAAGMLAAMIMGWVDFLKGKNYTVWQPER